MSKQRWNHKITSHSPPLDIYERSDRGDQLYLHWCVGKSHRRRKLQGVESVRAADGRVRKKLERRAIAAALKQYDGMENTDSSESSEDQGGNSKHESITITKGFDVVLDERQGKYATKTQQYKTMKRTKPRILRVLGKERTFESLTPRDYQLLWRTYAENRAEWGLGIRMAETAVSCLLAAANWLYKQGLIKVAVSPGEGWRATMEAEWAEIIGEVPQTFQPRHEEDDARKLWKHLGDADDRLRLSYELGAEYRLGQVIRGNRSDLDLSEGAGNGHGTYRIPGKGKKHGQLVYLIPEQRQEVDYALSGEGFLSEYEEAYQRGEIEDYPLFPGGKLRHGKAVVRKNPSRMNRRTLLDYFHELEDIAGVERVEGRGWYGIRRVSTDLTEDQTEDERVRDAAGGWKSASGTRERVYARKERVQVLTKAAEARRKARLGESAGTGNQSNGMEAEGALTADLLTRLGVPASKAEAVVALLSA